MFRSICCFSILAVLSGCATSYRTPSAGVNVADLAGVSLDYDIATVMKRAPAASFPARIAVAQAQGAGYYAFGQVCYGRGKYCVVSTQDKAKEEHLNRLSALPKVAGIAPLNRLMLPEELKSVRELRRAAASLQTDMLLVYTMDTRFHVDRTEVGPLQVIALGFLPNKKAKVTTTASAVLFDVRTGFVYGTAESTATERKRSTFWGTQDAIDKARRKAEQQSFAGLMDEFEVLWQDIATHSPLVGELY
ncbi:MAG: hypothetical protein AAF438_19035 [Pseudomonadota bacterium]